MDPAQAQLFAQELCRLSHQVQEMATELSKVQSPSTTTATNIPLSEPKIPLPDRFSGDRKGFFNFKNSCKLYFKLKPSSSGSENQRVQIIISLLQGDPQAWAFNLEPNHPALLTVDAFFEALGLLYDDPDRAATAESTLRNLQQGTNTAEMYCSEFRRWAPDSGWNDAALRSQFRIGLSDAIKDALVHFSCPASLEEAMCLAIRIDRRQRERRRELNTAVANYVPPLPPNYSTSNARSEEEPMQLGSTRLSAQEHSRRRNMGLCLYCGLKGHMLRSCPTRPGNSRT